MTKRGALNPHAKVSFDPDTLRPKIIAQKGDIRAIAAKIDADSEELRNFVMNTPMLRRALDEVIARGVDQSLAVLFKGLEDEHLGNQLSSAKVFLKSRAAQRRGFASADMEMRLPAKGGALTLTWLPPEPEGKQAPMIEGKAESED